MKVCDMLRCAEFGDVRILDETLLLRVNLNTQYLLGLETDRLLHCFRIQSGLSSNAKPYSGWEGADCGLRGHFVGHYLSACSQGFAATGDQRLCDRVEQIVTGLSDCQRANRNGYLSAFPESDLHIIETQYEGAWAPYYVLHKILAGMIDANRFCKNAEALNIALKLADYIIARLEHLSAEQIENMCRTDLKPNPSNEFGGLGESLQELADVTGLAKYDYASKIFDRDWFIKPLVNREDQLTGLHANTHIPMVLSLARRYGRTGDLKLKSAIEYFWERTAVARSFINGGSSGPRPDHAEKSVGAEHWPAPFKLAQTLTPKNNESCVTHNMLRLTDFLFQWTQDRRYADFHEQAWFNHVLTMQHPHDPGRYLYDHPLCQCSTKKFGQAHDSFWCCYGSTVEAYYRLAHGVYYTSEDRVIVNQFITSDLNWKCKISQVSRLAEEQSVRLTIQGENQHFTVKIRVPVWAKGTSFLLNNQEPVQAAGSYIVIERTWSVGDTISVKLPMHLYAETMPDDPKLIAFKYGPWVLAATTDLPLKLNQTSITQAIENIHKMDQPLSFSIKLADGTTVPMVPLNQIIDEQFGVYFHLS